MSNLDPGPRTAPAPAAEPRSPAAPWALLGVGLGGLADGILLHQVLQWHHMVSHDPDHPTTTVPGLQVNTLADGLFHVANWLAARRHHNVGRWLPSTSGRSSSRWTGDSGLPEAC
jgi:uncharacterized membrane protein